MENVIRKQGYEKGTSLSLVCPIIRLLDISGLNGVKKIELLNKRDGREANVVKGDRKVKIHSRSC